ncbi:MAG: HNH endonuclease [Candidatus Omnitrophica bacterium]|nr:HNH endonuclease [Candidatus Omnitrophota bacterium]
MPKCAIKDCKNFTRYKKTRQIYCSMHLARIKRHGHPNLQTGHHKLEKLPHHIVDDFIRKNCKRLIDIEIANELKKKGFKNASSWTVRYRRRRLGMKKYLYGEAKKHKAWVRLQAIKKYGAKCELCGYKLTIDGHHILPKKMGGLHETDNLMVLCPNCHALITRRYLNLKSRKDIPAIRKELTKLLSSS